MAAQRLVAPEAQLSPGSLNIRFVPTYPPSSVVGEAERLSVQSDPYTIWWRLLAAQLVFSTMCERTGAHASGPDSWDALTLP